MQQLWFDYGLGLKSVYLLLFYDFSLIFKIYIKIMNMQIDNLHHWPWDERHMLYL